MTNFEAKQKNTLALAHLGDAVYEMSVREYILLRCDGPADKLHRLTVAVVCADAQAKALGVITPLLTDDEQALIRRGRNAKTTAPKSTTHKNYSFATALETLFGYLYVTRQLERLDELFEVIAKGQIDAVMKAEFV